MMVIICTFSSSSWLAMMSFMFPPNPTSPNPKAATALFGMIDDSGEAEADVEDEEEEDAAGGDVRGDVEGGVSSLADER
jgi:hypothetical protein